MKKSTLLISVLFLSLNLSATDWTYSRLKSLYAKDAKQCLIVAKRYINYFPEKAAAYYFVSAVYFDKVELAKNARGEYLHINKAIGYAEKFDKLNNEELMTAVNWEDYLMFLQNKTEIVIEDLLKANQLALSNRLTTKINSLFNVEEIDLFEEAKDMEMLADNESTTILESNKIATQFYGMPKGNEIIQSYSLGSEQEMLKLINEEREKKGMGPLVWEEDLAKAARYHAFDLGSQNYFDHGSYDRDGTKLVKMGGTFERIGQFYAASFVNSENIAAGNEQAEHTYQQWYNSKGHYENMFNSYSKKVGIGVCYIPGSDFGYYWVFCTAL